MEEEIQSQDVDAESKDPEAKRLEEEEDEKLFQYFVDSSEGDELLKNFRYIRGLKECIAVLDYAEQGDEEAQELLEQVIKFAQRFKDYPRPWNYVNE